MRVLIFHGYLLRGTGSNIYNASLARALARLGHEVHLFCQDLRADELPFVDAVGSWRRGALGIRTLREPVRCTAYVPDIGGLLPVYVADAYEGFDAVPFPRLDDGQVRRYLDANVAAVSEVAGARRPDVALANHAIMGPAVLARALAGAVPYAVKVHGSALEYVVAPHPDRFLALAQEGLSGARGVLVGSGHVARRLWEVVGDGALRRKTRLGPPGVDTGAFRPRSADDAASGLRELAERLDAEGPAGWGGEEGAAAALRALDPRRERVVSYVGKLIVSKGVDLLVAAWPLVTGAVPDARLCIVGFGTYREPLAALVRALGRGDLRAALELAARGRELEGGEPGRLSYLAAFLDGLTGAPGEAYLAAAGTAMERVHFTGRLEHADLPHVLAASEAQVVPSTFPEAFGMVAVEAAACGALPLAAAHSGLAEVAATLAPALDPPIRPLLGFTPGPGAVDEIAQKLIAWLRLEEPARARAWAALAELAHERYGWEGVARGVIAAAEGRLDELPDPVPRAPASAGASG